MSRVKVDTFVMIVHFLNDQWEPCHITVGFFEIVDITGSAMALQVNDMLAKNGLITQVIAYVKGKRGNFSAMTTILIFVVSCQALRLTTHFVGACWGHAMSKCCQYATNDNKVSLRLIVYIKEA
jgi:hypothetical protein